MSIRWIAVFFAGVALVAGPAAAQHEHGQGATPPPAAPQHERHEPDPASLQPPHQHGADAGMSLFPPGEASGTSWLPETTPMYGIAGQAGRWQLMAHGNAFVQLLHESGDRGSTQAGSINWIMGMARRELAGGRFGVRGMFSLEPWTIAGCGYPDLLATGEVCEGTAIHDRQHPHDLLMELAAEYERPMRGGLRWQLYGGPAGEPALGPVAYPHRVSAMPNPLAPISHHWLDATHITFGVFTGGISGATWKAEASVFNGREPDEHRAGLDLAPLDSVSGRLWFLPARGIALQVSAGHLAEAEAAHGGAGRTDVTRLTASATYHRPLQDEGVWASTAAWGRNSEAGESTHALLLETNALLRGRDSWFGRLELAGKPAEDLEVHGTGEVFTVAKLQAGYARYLRAWRGLSPGFGGSVSLGIVPAALVPEYGRRGNAGLALFVTIRPAGHRM